MTLDSESFRSLRLQSLLITAVCLCCGQNLPPAANSEVHLALSCPVSPCRFRSGEVIPLDLVFSAEVPGYVVYGSYRDRFEFSMKLDTFTVSPSQGASDPVGNGRAVLAGRYNLNAAPLRERVPVKVRLELNQWVQFDRPGSYTVTISSLRASRVSEIWGTINWDPEHPERLTGGPIQVEIVDADLDWQRREFARILGALPATLASNTDTERAAVRALAYLGTDDALEEIRRRLKGNLDPIDLDWRFAQLVLLQRDSRRAPQ